MAQTEIVEEFNKLPFEAQKQVKDYILFLRSRYENTPSQYKQKTGDISGDPFIGIWKDRTDLTDSRAWIRSVRKSEWRIQQDA